MAVAYSSFSQIDDTDQSNSVSVSVPSGLASGNLWLVLLEVDTNYNASNTILVPSGWTAVSSGGPAGGNSYPLARAFYKVAGASESAQTFSLSMPGGIWNVYGASIRITGADTSSPIDTTAFTTASKTPPARTVANDGSLSFVWAANSLDSGSVIMPTGYTLVGSQNTSWCIYIAGYKAVNAGTETPGAFTLPGTDTFAETIIIKPAGAGSTSLIPPSPASRFSHLLVR